MDRILFQQAWEHTPEGCCFANLERAGIHKGWGRDVLTSGIILLRKRLACFNAGIQFAGNNQCKAMLMKIGIKP